MPDAVARAVTEKKIIESKKKDKIIKNFGIFFVIILGEVI